MEEMATLGEATHLLVDLAADRADLEIVHNTEQAVVSPVDEGNLIQEEALIGEEISDLVITILTAAAPCHHHVYPNQQ